MKHKKLKLAVLALTMLLISSSTVYAVAPVTRDYTINTTDKNYMNYSLEQLEQGDLTDVPKEIKVDGKTYKAVNLTLEEISQEKPIKKTRTFNGLSEKNVPKSITVKTGVELSLKDVDWTENTRTAATGTMTFNGTDGRPDAPQTKDITTTLPDGRTITVTGHLQRIEKTGSGYSKPFSVTARFIGDRDVSGYNFGDVFIPNNPASPVFEGYEATILNHLGYDDQKYRLTDGKWTSDYIQENSQTVRYAEFSGFKQTSNWTAYYTETITTNSPQITTYDATATYTNGVDKTKYEVLATVTYEQTGLSRIQKILIASVAIIVLAGLIAVILMIVRKKRDKETVTE